MGSTDTQAGKETNPRRCSRCGYDLAGIGEAKACPECAWEVDKEHPGGERSRFFFQFLRALAIVSLLLAFLLVPQRRALASSSASSQIMLVVSTLTSFGVWVGAFRSRDRFGGFPWIAVKTWPLVWIACGVLVLGARCLLGYWP